MCTIIIMHNPVYINYVHVHAECIYVIVVCVVCSACPFQVTVTSFSPVCKAKFVDSPRLAVA